MGRHKRTPPLPAIDTNVSLAQSRLLEAAETGQSVELILVLRGRVRSLGAGERWAVHRDGRRATTFATESVLSVTELGGQGASQETPAIEAPAQPSRPESKRA
jgi:hypothetical protein